MVSARKVVLGAGCVALLGAIVHYVNRDVLHYAIYTPESFGRFWPTRMFIIPHAFAATVGIFAGLLQFSTYLRRRWPGWHRRFGYLYAFCCLVGAPAAIGLAFHSDCLVCRPSLGILAVFWLAATMIAVLLARRRDFARHRQFMIRSFVYMNVFVVVRVAYDLFVSGTGVSNNRILSEWLAVMIPILATEIWLTWVPTLTAGAGHRVPHKHDRAPANDGS
jgi:Predicted membrane protein (DUF2306)